MGDQAQAIRSEPAHEAARQRARNQFSYFATGAALFGLSVFITRRAVVSRYRAFTPSGHFSSSRALPQVNGAYDAASALTLATLNVATCGAMLTGGAMWALDISHIQDLRRYVRQAPGMAVDKDLPKEDDIEAWMTFFATSMQGKVDGDQGNVIKRLAEAESKKD